MLHITNGDAAGGEIERAGLPGTVLPWRDVLPEGPVPTGLDAADLRVARARYLASMGWAEYDATLADFAARDAALAGAATQDEVVLWFEHDLYDQLQLIQIFDALADPAARPPLLTAIVIGAHPEVTPFHGLGQLTAAQLAALFPGRAPVTADEIALARTAWAAFRAPDPTAITTLLAGDTTPLPFLRGALIRHLDDFPAVGDGLARTERQILEAVAAGTSRPADLFRACITHEERPFMGDASFFARVGDLAAEPEPLLVTASGAPFGVPADWSDPDQRADFHAQTLAITSLGAEVLASRADWVHLHPADRWHGGVHLTGPDPAWRWDAATQRLVRTRA
jgi:hypothetical protein